MSRLRSPLRRAQSLLEFLPIAIAFFGLCAVTIVFAYYLLVGWGGGRALAAAGLSYTTSGSWNAVAFDAQALSLGVVVDPADTAISIVITKADGSTGPCPAATPCDGWLATPSIDYGDHVAISIAKTVGADVQAWIAMPPIGAAWSGIAQRATIENPAQGSQVGTISGSVTDEATGQGIVGALVSYTTAGGSGSTVTASGGAYTLANVPAGSITLTTSALGYVSAENIFTLSANQSLSQNVNLTEGAYIRFFVTSDVETTNFVTNDGFEAGTSDWSVAASALGVGSATTGPGTTATNPLEGNDAGTFTAAAGATPTGIKTSVSGLTIGVQYAATVWMRGASGSAYLRFGNDLDYATSSSLFLSSSWQSTTVNWTASATSATLVVYTTNGNPVVLDAVRIWESDGRQTGASVTSDLGDSATELGNGYYELTVVPPADPTTYFFQATSGSLYGCVTSPVSTNSATLYLEISVSSVGPGC
jgi:hypothetical protein